MKNSTKLITIVCIMFLMSCSNRNSLQGYFVNHQDDADFVAVDIATSLLDSKKVGLSKEGKEALKSIKKLNFLALPIKEETKDRYAEEKTTIDGILKSNSYETLMRFGSNGTKAVIKMQGNGDEIDEMIVFASNQEKGLALVRVLGDDMKPESIIQLVQSIDKGDVDISVFKNIMGDIDIK